MVLSHTHNIHYNNPLYTFICFIKYIYAYTAKNDDQIATHFYYFLEQFYNLHTNYRTSSSTTSPTEGVRYTTRPLYLTGESHAGHYIPYLTSYILNKNKNKDIHT